MSVRIEIAISMAFLMLLPLTGCPPVCPGENASETSEPNHADDLEPNAAEASEPNEPAYSGPWYVDDDGAHDPSASDPNISDPAEDGSEQHPFDAIQEALDVAGDGQTVVVLDGTYTGIGNRDLDFRGKALTLRSANGPENCVIECEYRGRGFYFHSGETEAAIVEGLTVTHGREGPGAGVHCDSSSPTLIRCVLHDNRAFDLTHGGGIYCYRSNPTISNCTITDNFAGQSADGGGVYCEASNPRLSNCTISSNGALMGYGAGLYCRGGSMRLADCTISGNSSDEGLGGGGGFANDASLTLVGCTVSGNRAFDCIVAGGIGCRGGTLTLTNCTISHNDVNSITPMPSVYGGGIYCSGSNSTITNCTISDNRAGSGGGVFCERGTTSFINCTISENDASDGGAVLCERNTTSFVNCTIEGNRATNGAGVVVCNNSDADFVNCTIAGHSSRYVPGGIVCAAAHAVLDNCIVRSNAGPEITLFSEWPPDSLFAAFTTVTISYSNLDGGEAGVAVGDECVLYWALGNIDSEPLFVQPGYWDDNGTSEDTRDDYWVAGDSRLSAGSPCIDAGDNTAVPADLADLDSDGETDERTPLDLGGLPRFVDDPATADAGIPDPPAYPNVVDIGAHEFGGS